MVKALVMGTLRWLIATMTTTRVELHELHVGVHACIVWSLNLFGESPKFHLDLLLFLPTLFQVF